MKQLAGCIVGGRPATSTLHSSPLIKHAILCHGDITQSATREGEPVSIVDSPQQSPSLQVRAKIAEIANSRQYGSKDSELDLHADMRAAIGRHTSQQSPCESSQQNPKHSLEVALYCCCYCCYSYIPGTTAVSRLLR